MNVQAWLLFLHVMAAMVWIGGGVAMAFMGLRVRRSADRASLAEFSGTLGQLGLRVFMPALLVVLGTGLALVLDTPAWRLSQPWIVIGLALFAVAFLIGSIYVSRVSIALERVMGRPGPDPSEAAALVGRWLLGNSLILLVLVAAVWDMIFKPIA